jgi:type I restriction enzyme S subunit
MSFPRYPEYKDSGVEWLGEVPSHWSVKRLRFVAELNPSKSEIKEIDKDTLVSFLPMEAIGDDGSLNLEREKPINELESGYTYFRNGDVAIAKITPCYENGKGALMRGLSNNIGFGTTELIIVRPKQSETSGIYLYRLFTSNLFHKMGESYMYGAGGQKRVPDDFVRNFKIAFPSLQEQTAIASFLDRETTKIDELIAEQKRLIELLKEKRQAVISHAVTKGLNPDAKMKDSGIEWLGLVPEGWEVKRIKNLFDIKKRISGVEGYEVLSITQQGIKIKDIESGDGQLSMDYSKYQFVEVGDFAMNHMDLLTGYVDISSFYGVTSPDYRVFSIKNKEKCFDKYYLYLFQMGYKNKIFFAYGQGASQLGRWRFPTDQFNNFAFPQPPLHEQIKISSFLKNEITKIDSLFHESKRSIDLLQERRTALISAAVTGKIDVSASLNTGVRELA